MSEIFINYRTGDGEKTAALLRQGLSHRFGPGHAFHASQSIVPGESWPERLLTAVRRSSVLLAVIGPDWTNFRTRLDDPEDWVRKEIEEAFRCEVPVVPVLDGRKTNRLSRADLPPALRRLADLQSIAFDSGDTDVCVARLGDLMAELIPGLDDGSGTEAGTPAPGSVTNSIGTVNGTAVQSRDLTGDVGTVVKGAHGPVHTGNGNIYSHSRHVSGDRHFSGDGMTYFEGDHHGAIQHRFGERDGHEDKDR
ncbi:toll/interleukin-1 receptor domain-containing protein [Streptomyces rubrogriseus]|uniref:Toll/interleukin-1 receptor domain-containing protein n=1 Tax=Streptomyces rubrogriseus TaxID=194673 RepID=A0A6G3TI65_9ACTN|nr:toll/interleukin-1 receptor domain-containing protein [Streptomyces rubrogriseus]NEC36400.1 toll/interleukin-1 receptor domain-containing protein [Streptomyces rubrogriseus]